MSGDPNKVWEIKALKKPGEEEARKILERIAKQVQPIMRKHNWRVKLLSEFCPNNPSLLGVNVGSGVNIKLRLRRHNRDWDFIPFDQVLDTMLHELCHNAHGPHNASFYKLWDELRKECEELMAKGITGTGEGFDLPGRRLGGFSRQAPLRQSTLAAAQKRAKLLPSGPKRVGGDSTIMASLSPIQAAAMAAERRFQDEVWCGSQSVGISGDDEDSHVNHGSNDDKRSHISESSNFVDLTKDFSGFSSTPDHDTGARKQSHKFDCHPKPSFVDLSGASASRPVLSSVAEDSVMWECGSCTLLNPPLAPLCKVCGSQKPKEVDTKNRSWFCKFCTLENSSKLDKCSACDQWRYSHGPPASSRAPNVGT